MKFFNLPYRQFYFPLLVISHVYAADTTSLWNLQKCIDTAQSNNFGVKKSINQIKFEELQLNQVRSYVLPTANITSLQAVQVGKSIDPVTNTFVNVNLLASRYQISGELPIYNFGGLKNQIKAQDFNNKIALQNAELYINNLSLSVTILFLKSIFYLQQMRLYQIELMKTLNQLKITKESISLGNSGKLNLFRFESKKSIDSINILESSNNYYNSIIDLKSIINIDLKTPIELESPNLESFDLASISELENPEIIYNRALNSYAKAKINSMQINAYKFKIKSTKNTQYPNFSFVYNISSVFSNFIKDKPFKKWWDGFGVQMDANFNQIVGLNVSIPVANNQQLRNSVKRDNIALNNLYIEHDEIEAELRKNVYKSTSDALNSYSKLKETEKSVANTRSIYEMTLDYFKLGGISSIEVINAQNEFLKANEILINNKIDFFLKLKIVEYYKYGKIAIIN